MTLDQVEQVILSMDIAVAATQYASNRKTQRQATQRADTSLAVAADEDDECGGILDEAERAKGFLELGHTGVEYIEKLAGESPEIEGLLGNIAKYAGGAVATLGRIATFVDLEHYIIISGDVRVFTTQRLIQQTHLGPAGHAPAARATRTLTVKVISYIPDNVVFKCGPLVGIKFPKKGGVPDITTDWHTSMPSLKEFKQLGEVVATKKTDHDGISTFTFTPANEFAPGVGSVGTQRTEVGVVVKKNADLGNVPGKLTDFLVEDYPAGFIQISYHIPYWHAQAYWTTPGSGPQLTYFVDGAGCPEVNNNALGSIQGPFSADLRWKWYFGPDESSGAIGSTNTGALTAGWNSLESAVGANASRGASAGRLDVLSSTFQGGADPLSSDHVIASDVNWEQADFAGNGWLYAERDPSFFRSGSQGAATSC